jgi:hypothetical protein
VILSPLVFPALAFRFRHLPFENFVRQKSYSSECFQQNLESLTFFNGNSSNCSLLEHGMAKKIEAATTKKFGLMSYNFLLTWGLYYKTLRAHNLREFFVIS